MMSDRPEWFAPKRYGIGAGLPMAWQGWVITTGFLTAILGTAYAFEERPDVIFSIVVPLVAAMLVIASRTTRGGWHWRWGERD